MSKQSHFIRTLVGGPLDGTVEHFPVKGKAKSVINKSCWLKGVARNDNFYLLKGEARRPIDGETIEYYHDAGYIPEKQQEFEPFQQIGYAAWTR